MHEIITLQLGRRSNYLATHFWNAQESYFTYSAAEESPVDHDVHFRPGLGPAGQETYTPRALIYDFKAEFGSLKKINELYDVQGSNGPRDGLWDGSTVVQQQPLIGKNAYQQSLEDNLQPPTLSTETVRYWSDFNRVFYHPKSILSLSQHEMNSSLRPIETWSAGEEMYTSLSKEHDPFDEDFRAFAEECDLLQGVQIITGADDCWGGFASRYVDRLRDEVGKVSLWVWGIEDGRVHQRDVRQQKTVNSARSIHALCSQASLYVRMADPPANLPEYIALDEHAEWHTSALLCTALETVTLPSRLKSTNGLCSTLSELEAFLRGNGNQPIAKLRLEVESSAEQNGYRQEHRDASFPGPYRESRDEAQTEKLSNLELNTGIDMDSSGREYDRARSRKKPAHVFSGAVVVRNQKISEEMLPDGVNIPNGERLSSYPQELTRPAKLRTYQSSLEFPLLDSFPSIYHARSSERTKLATRTSLSVESSVAEHLQSMRGAVGTYVGPDERETLLNRLGEIADMYQSGWSSSGESAGEDEY
ncbi:MAG: mtDNA inheritance, partitioning of the mitochondrial organelle [Peltula sp. TS41687]|nr:MAG: mtDNA inheritance, partitioning of the mitochondrial organelle [Peltula sp. TS41687]